jgi:hypothetical protein
MRILRYSLSVLLGLECILLSEDKGVWIQNWNTLTEAGYFETKAELDGVINGGISYSVTAEAKIIALSELEKNSKMIYFGKSKNGHDALNAQLTKLELTVDGKKTSVPQRALRDILNPMLGSRTSLLFGKTDKEVSAIIISGPDGAESYEVAFIFNNNKFSRRQIRSSVRSRDGWPLLEDKAY